MKIRFCGATREVTGSKHLIIVNDKRVLLDCGLYQGYRREAYAKNNAFPFKPSSVDALVLSHSHIDHCGNIPGLVKKGFEGSIYATSATRDLCSYMLMDSAMIQERDAEYLKKHEKTHKSPIEPLYDEKDVKKSLNQFVSVGYERAFAITDGVAGCFYEAGHILGSAISHFILYDKTADKRCTLAYSGDLGRKGLPILKDPQYFPPTDYLIIESTYGDRTHDDVANIQKELADIVNKTAERGGKILIPSFALERTQELIYHFNLLSRSHEIPNIPIFVDSPLSIRVTDVFKAHPECFDKETAELIKNKENPFGFGELKYISDVEDSKKLNEYHGPCIIIAASGMAEHGRILHHLKNNIEDPKTTVLFVGFQADHTLGRKLVDGAKIATIFGEDYKVNAEIHKIDAFSGHADKNELMDFVMHIRGLKKIFIVHGEEKQSEAFAQALKEKGYETHIPKFAEEVEIE
ncbi:MBL fold metallo-hydrolase [Candidatus Peregrinibacteria bacterium]|nr:MBL fold metallo-hydrolase [Candidatus Peregrinibacteria bacterium]